MIIKLQIPTPEIMGEGDKYDKVNDDRYLITDIKLSGSPVEKAGMLHIECVKESYAMKVEDAKPLDEGTGPEIEPEEAVW
jgi:hypothetical protein